MNANGQLRAFVERVERIEEEIKTLNDDKSDIYKEIRSAGFDVKTVRKVVAKRKIEDHVRSEQDALFDTYWDALHGSGLVRVHVRENIEQFDPLTDEFRDDNIDPKLAHTIVTGLQTETGRAALIAAVDILIEQEEAEEENAPRPSVNDEPCSKAVPQDAPSPAGIGSELLAGREGRPDGEAASVDLPTNSEIASASQGEAQDHSDQRETDREAAATGVGANEGGEDVESSAKRAGLEGGPVNLEPTGPVAEWATSLTAKPPSPLRPHCRNPGETCGGSGSKHCHSCSKAMREQEEFA